MSITFAFLHHCDPVPADFGKVIVYSAHKGLWVYAVETLPNNRGKVVAANNNF